MSPEVARTEGGISVERLTDKHFNKSLGYYMKCSGCCERSIACNECEEFEALVDRLGAIEEILGNDYDLDRLRELVEADRANRCIVLPKDGMIYYIEESDGERWIGNKPIQDIIFLYGWGLASLKSSISEIGKTKHFTREAAEATLEGDQHEQNL